MDCVNQTSRPCTDYLFPSLSLIWIFFLSFSYFVSEALNKLQSQRYGLILVITANTYGSQNGTFFFFFSFFFKYVKKRREREDGRKYTRKDTM